MGRSPRPSENAALRSGALLTAVPPERSSAEWTVLSVEESLHLVEVTLRDLIADLLPDVTRLGVTDARLSSWDARREEERRRRVGAVIDERLLSYSDFTDLETIVAKNWTTFKPCFGDLGRLKTYLHRLSALRNPGAHSRPLLPFEEALVVGMCGEIRQQVTIFRSEGMGAPEPEHFPRITEVRDSYGNRTAGLTEPTAPPVIDTGLILRPGDELIFSGSAWDPADGSLSWHVGLNRGPTLYAGEGPSFECLWRVAVRDITEAALVAVRLRSRRDYHRLSNGDDDRVVFKYRVLPSPPTATNVDPNRS